MMGYFRITSPEIPRSFSWGTTRHPDYSTEDLVIGFGKGGRDPVLDIIHIRDEKFRIAFLGVQERTLFSNTTCRNPEEARDIWYSILAGYIEGDISILEDLLASAHGRGYRRGRNSIRRELNALLIPDME